MAGEDPDYDLILEVAFPDDSTAVLTFRLMDGSAEGALYDTFTWERRGDEWHCVMHSRAPVTSIH